MSIRWALVDQALVSAGSFAFGIALVRTMGVDAYGAYTLIWGAIQFLVVIQGSLFLAPFQTLGPALEQRYGESYLAAVFGQQQLFGMAAIAAMAIAISFFAPTLPHGLLPIQLAVGSTTYLFLTQEYFRRLQLASGRGLLAILGDVFRYGGPIAVLLLMTASMEIGLSDVFLMIALSSALAVALNAKLYRHLSGPGRAIYKDVLRDHWPFVRWLTPSIAFQWINANLVFYAVGWAHGEGQVGILRMAQLLSILFLVLFEALENVVPREAVIRLRSGGIIGMERYIIRMGTWMGLALTIFLGIVIPSTEFWLNLFFGEKGASVSAGLVWLFCLAPVLIAPTYCLNVVHRSIGGTKALFVADGSAAVVSALGALTVIWAGIYAAILTMLTAQAIRLTVLIWLYRDARERGAYSLNASGEQACERSS